MEYSKQAIKESLFYKGSFRKTCPRKMDDILQHAWKVISGEVGFASYIFKPVNWSTELTDTCNEIAMELGFVGPNGEKGAVINVLQDQTIEIKEYFTPGEGSLSALNLKTLVVPVNQFDLFDIGCIFLAVKIAPFPYGAYEKQLKNIIAVEKEKGVLVAQLENVAPLGEWRKQLLNRAKHGFNAPHDSYITAMSELKKKISN